MALSLASECLRLAYPVSLTEDEEGGFVVTCRDLPEVVSQGEDVAEALANAADAIAEAIAGRINDREEIPRPSAPRRGEYEVPVPVGVALKAAVYLAFRKRELTQSELARRLLNPRYQTTLRTLERALELLGQQVVVTLP